MNPLRAWPRPAAVVLPMAFLLALMGTAAHASEALARKSGCLGCHAAAAQLVGPSYKAVAERYAGQPDAVAQLAAKVRKGGAGVWGEVAMPPQAGLSEGDAKKLVTWILKGAR